MRLKWGVCGKNSCIFLNKMFFYQLMVLFIEPKRIFNLIFQKPITLLNASFTLLANIFLKSKSKNTVVAPTFLQKQLPFDCSYSTNKCVCMLVSYGKLAGV